MPELPLLLIKAMWQESTVVNTEVAIGTAIGVVSSYDANLLSINDGPIDIQRMGNKGIKEDGSC